MSTPSTAPCVYAIPDVDCDCTYSTIAPVVGPIGTVVATKVLDDFRFYGLRGLGGTTITQNLANNTVDISSGGAGTVTLQNAYDNGFSITTAGSNPVEIIAPVNQPALSVRDTGAIPYLTINNSGVSGLGNVLVSTGSGLQFRTSPGGVLAPTSLSPYMQLIVDSNPDAATDTATMQSAATIGTALDANDVFRYTPTTTPANTVTLFDIDVVGYSSALGATFAIKALAKLAPVSPNQVVLISTSSTIDPALAGLSVDVRYTSNTLHLSLIGGPLGANYLVRASARLTMLTF